MCYWVTSVTILSNKCYCVISVTTWCADRLTWPLITASGTLSPLWHPPLAFALSSGSILLCISHVKCNSMPFRLFHFIVSLRDIRKGTVACHQKFWRTLDVCLLTTEKFWMGQQIQRHFPSVDMIPLSQSNLLHWKAKKCSVNLKCNTRVLYVTSLSIPLNIGKSIGLTLGCISVEETLTPDPRPGTTRCVGKICTKTLKQNLPPRLNSQMGSLLSGQISVWSEILQFKV